MSGPVVGDEIQEGRTTAQTRALHRKEAAGLKTTIVPCEGGWMFHALLAAQDTGGEPTRLPDCHLKEVEPKPTSYSAAKSLIHYGVWTETMQAEFDGLEAAETFAEISEIPAGSNIVESNGL